MSRYRRIRIAGKGSFGCCWLVENEVGEKCILKQIDISKMPVKQKREAANEVQILSKLRHPFIINYRESYMSDGLLCIITDYAEKGDLYRLIHRQKRTNQLLSESTVLRWFTQIALALKHMHDRHILHRDLKTQNIFLSGPGLGMVKMGDFGIARVLQHTQDCARTAIGTPYYLSPEICQERPYNHKSDVWSLGCVLYELATLQHAFDADSMRGLVMKILKGVPPQVPLAFSAALRALVPEMLTKNPQGRPSIDEVLRRPIMRGMIRQLLREVEANHQHGEVNGCSPATRGNAVAESRLPGVGSKLASGSPALEHKEADGVERGGRSRIEEGIHGYLHVHVPRLGMHAEACVGAADDGRASAAPPQDLSRKSDARASSNSGRQADLHDPSRRAVAPPQAHLALEDEGTELANIDALPQAGWTPQQCRPPTSPSRCGPSGHGKDVKQSRLAQHQLDRNKPSTHAAADSANRARTLSVVRQHHPRKGQVAQQPAHVAPAEVATGRPHVHKCHTCTQPSEQQMRQQRRRQQQPPQQHCQQDQLWPREQRPDPSEFRSDAHERGTNSNDEQPACQGDFNANASFGGQQEAELRHLDMEDANSHQQRGITQWKSLVSEQNKPRAMGSNRTEAGQPDLKGSHGSHEEVTCSPRAAAGHPTSNGDVDTIEEGAHLQLISTLQQGLNLKHRVHSESVEGSIPSPLEEHKAPGFLQLLKPDGQVLDLQINEKDSLFYRIEALRVYLEQEIGLDDFLFVYQYLNNVAQNEAAGCQKGETDANKELHLESNVSPKTIDFLPLVHQLIVCEDKCFGN